MWRYLVCVLLACGITENPSSRMQPTAFPAFTSVSDTRDKPTHIPLDQLGAGEAKSSIEKAGVWWYSVDVSHHTGGTFVASTTYDGSPGKVRVSVIAGDRELAVPAVDSDPNKTRLELPLGTTATVLLRVMTTAPVKLRIFVSRK
jgi:hypothetical protein